MDYDIIGIVWPTPENYQRFRALYGDDLPATFLEFVQMSTDQLKRNGIAPERVERVMVEPEEMAAWCLSRHGKIDAETRALFAMFKLRSKYGKGSDAVN